MRIFVLALLALVLTACGGGSSDSSTDSSVTNTDSPTEAPKAISNLRLSVSGEDTFTFRWTDVDGATYYNLWENKDGASNYTRVGSGITSSRVGYDDPYTYTALVSERLNALYIVQSCNDIGCAISTPISVSDFYTHVEPFKLTFSQTKSFDFTWPSTDGATHYKLMENADGSSGFSQVGENIASGTLSYSHIVPLYARMNAQYILQSCNSSDCTNSETISVNNNLANSIGLVKASNTGEFDRFGYKVVLSNDGNTMAISAYHESSGATGVNGDQSNNDVGQSGAVYVFTRDINLEWSQQAYLKASNTEKIDRFGNALSISADGNTLAVGAQDEDSNAVGINGDQTNNSLHKSGAVYIFTRDSSSDWSQQAYVKASNPGLYDAFGVSLALSSDGNTLAVGANGENSNAKGINGDQSNITESSSGAVYVFTRSDTYWSQQAYVKASNSYRHTYFGKSLALSSNGSTLAVGAPNEHSNSTDINGDQNNYDARDSGAVYMFTRDNSNLWTQHSYIKASNTQEGDLFAGSLVLSADGKTLVVGAISEDSNATGINGNQDNNDDYFSGAVYVFTQSISNIWSQQAYIKASNTDKHDQFGYSIALSSDGDTLAVSATSESSKSVGMNGNQSDNSGYSGAIYLFTRNGLSWSQQAYIKPREATSHDYTGRSIALSGEGETLAVGSTSEKSNVTGIGGAQIGYDFVYESGAVFLY